ncbi:putative peroxidase family protein [Lyophyllum shimeji]|uniref:Peroxidase n=1 Tax=Lyophyllum shimeji TaxID=47721 RepID=A0A9P3PGX3_LYOSH|nr:putative peroxidase family protein [Lyophyllum shimeji]
MLSLPSVSLAALVVLNGFCVGIANSAATMPQWPNPQLDFLEFQLGFELHIMTWRAAHDETDGSGGLDASIAVEIDRPQNIGMGMAESLDDFVLFTTPYVALADVIAMGAVMAVASCGGPVIPYRGGRVDARVAGPATVPEPQQDLSSHIGSFERQVFTQEEMIALVA